MTTYTRNKFETITTYNFLNEAGEEVSVKFEVNRAVVEAFLASRAGQAWDYAIGDGVKVSATVAKKP